MNWAIQIFWSIVSILDWYFSTYCIQFAGEANFALVLPHKTNTLVIVHCNLSVNFVFDQLIEDSTVNFSKEPPCIVSIFRYYDKAVVIQNVTVDITGGTCLLRIAFDTWNFWTLKPENERSEGYEYRINILLTLTQ